MKNFFKKLTSLAVCVTFSVCALLMPVEAYGEVQVSSASAILIEAESGRIIFENDAYERRPMASTTKIMSTLVALEQENLDEYFTVDKDAINVEGSSMGLKEGDRVTLRTLCYGMMLPSGNDAANATAVKVAGSVENFVDMMNEKAREIGLSDTHFVTPSGLDDYTDDHYSTAYDMAKLTAYAMKNEQFCEICSQADAKVNFGNPPFDRWLSNNNKLLDMCEGVIGVKTGFTDKARRCLVSACERDGVTLICVTLNAPDDWNDHIKMLDYGFLRLKECVVRPALPSKISVVGGVENSVSINVKPFVYSYLDSQNSYYRLFIDKFVYAPITSGTVVGYCEYYLNGAVVETQPIVVNESVQRM